MFYENISEKQVENKNKEFGKKIKKAFYITILFIIFLHSFTILDSIYFVVTRKQFEFIDEETGSKNIKGYVVTSVLFFLITLFIIY